MCLLRNSIDDVEEGYYADKEDAFAMNKPLKEGWVSENKKKAAEKENKEKEKKLETEKKDDSSATDEVDPAAMAGLSKNQKRRLRRKQKGK